MEANSVAIVGKLPRFNGKTPINSFLKLIQKRAHLEGWNEDKQASIIRYLCADVAEAFLDSKPELETSTLDELVLALRTRFKIKLSQPEAFAKLMKVEQNHLSINEYVGSIETMAADFADIIPALRDINSRDELLISVFNNGAHTTIKEMLAARDFATWNDLIQAATKCETVIKERRSAQSGNVIGRHEINSTFHYNRP